MAHAELEGAGEEARARHADDEALQDAEPRIGLHDAHEPQDRRAGEQAVGVERDHEFVVLAPALAEVAHVAGLEAGVLLAVAIEKLIGILGFLLPGGDRLLLGGDHLGARAVAQNEIIEAVAETGGIQARLDRDHAREGARRIFVPHGHENRGALENRVVVARAVGQRDHRVQRIAGEVEHREADHRVPESDHDPGRIGQKHHEQKRIEDRKPVGGQDFGEPGRHEGDGGYDQDGEGQPAAGQHRHPLGAGRRSFVGGAERLRHLARSRIGCHALSLPSP